MPNSSQTYSFTNGGCWQSSQLHLKFYQLPRYSAFENAWYCASFAIPSRKLETKVVGSACTPWARPIKMVNLCPSLSSDDVGGSFQGHDGWCRWPACRGNRRCIHHVGRSQTIVGPTCALAVSFRNCIVWKATTSYASPAQSSKYDRCRVRLSRIKATSSLGISPILSPCLSAKIWPPSTVFIFVPKCSPSQGE